MSRLAAALDRLTDWHRTKALPLWAGAAADGAGAFYEALDFAGRPLTGRKRRVRVQCRQIHVFTDAARLGWLPQGEAIAARGFDRLLETACPRDGVRGCVHALDDEGGVADHLRDLYDQAFLLLACAARIKATKDDKARIIADRVLTFLDREFASPHGGYRENDRGGLPRRQNPHMHLFEALMALHEATGDTSFLARAQAIAALFESRFFDRQNAVVREFFNDDWTIIDKVSDRLEPGHMMEWVFLLDQHQRLSGADQEPAKRQLYEVARAMRVEGSVFLPNEASLRGTVRAGRRLWPQTEHLRAACVLAGDGDEQAGSDAADLIDALFQTYFDQETQGLWCDEYDIEGAPVAKDVPASILYHIHEAVSLAAESRHRQS